MPPSQQTRRLPVTEGYTPENTLGVRLHVIENEIRVDYISENELNLENGLTAERVGYNALYSEGDVSFRFEVEETYSPLGLILQVKTNLALASVFVLVQSLEFGEPTQVYTPETDVADPTNVHQTVTAEWYHNGALEAGIHQSRLAEFMHETGGMVLTTKQLEEYAEIWFDEQ